MKKQKKALEQSFPLWQACNTTTIPLHNLSYLFTVPVASAILSTFSKHFIDDVVHSNYKLFPEIIRTQRSLILSMPRRRKQANDSFCGIAQAHANAVSATNRSFTISAPATLHKFGIPHYITLGFITLH